MLIGMGKGTPMGRISGELCSAFTLIELLIVVAIIAILAAIAVPNFLEAQVRAKVSRSKADMRSLATAIESYNVDNNKYPEPDQSNMDLTSYMAPLTTPVAYINVLPRYTWAPWVVYLPPDWAPVQVYCYHYECKAYWDKSAASYPGYLTWDNYDSTGREDWWLAATGPDGEQNRQTVGVPGSCSLLYDPTNGTVSEGDIILMGP